MYHSVHGEKSKSAVIGMIFSGPVTDILLIAAAWIKLLMYHASLNKESGTQD